MYNSNTTVLTSPLSSLRSLVLTAGASACSVVLPLTLLACGPASPSSAAPVVVSAAPDADDAQAQPSAAAFDSGKRLMVEGGPALGCEARGVGDWVRLSCSGLSYLGALPWRVSALSHSKPTADSDTVRNMVERQEEFGRVSIVWHHGPSTSIEASFSWFPYIMRFVAVRPPNTTAAPPGQGVGEFPTPLGRFVGAPPGTAAELIQAVCACPPRLAPALLLKGYQCESPTIDPEAFDAWDPACLRHMQKPDGCQNMNECLTLEPSHYKLCAEDEVRSGPPPHTGCQKACDAERECPSGFECKPTEQLSEDGRIAQGPTACFPAEDAYIGYYQALQTYLKSQP